MNARDIGFQMGMTKAAASPWTNTLPSPDVERWRRLALAGTVAGAALGTAGGAALALALARKKNRQSAA